MRALKQISAALLSPSARRSSRATPSRRGDLYPVVRLFFAHSLRTMRSPCPSFSPRSVKCRSSRSRREGSNRTATVRSGRHSSGGVPQKFIMHPSHGAKWTADPHKSFFYLHEPWLFQVPSRPASYQKLSFPSSVVVALIETVERLLSALFPLQVGYLCDSHGRSSPLLANSRAVSLASSSNGWPSPETIQVAHDHLTESPGEISTPRPEMRREPSLDGGWKADPHDDRPVLRKAGQACTFSAENPLSCRCRASRFSFCHDSHTAIASARRESSSRVSVFILSRPPTS